MPDTFCARVALGEVRDRQPVQRLAVAHGNRINFSKPNELLVFDPYDWVEVEPGNGEVIVGLEALPDRLIVSKRSADYVFYGVSTDSTGGPVFNYRVVRRPRGLRQRFAAWLLA